MRYDEVPEDLRKLAYDFFFWFSRFEAALKEQGHLGSINIGAPAVADWGKFVSKYQDDFTLTASYQTLIAANPKRQIVAADGLAFAELRLNGRTELDQVVALLKTVRNNLFHGGKHGADHWDDPERTACLLKTGVQVLKDLARNRLSGDFDRYY